MLERTSLLIRHWEAGYQQLGWRASIEDGQTNQNLGHALRPSGPPPSYWFRGWGPVLVEIRERDDEPLLLTLRRSWGPGMRWRIEDADGVSIGRIRGPFLLGRRDQLLATLGWVHLQGGTYTQPDGDLLGRTVPGDQQVWLHFEPDAFANPFVQMVLLAGTLVHHQRYLGSL